MKKLFTMLAMIFITMQITAQPLTGIKTIPGSYATIQAAITALNTNGVGTGGVIFNVTAGHTETFTTPTAGLITATGTSANTIVFQKSGAGANPLVTAATPGTGTMDYVFCVLGTDYITFDGISIQENAANTTTTQQMEWGYAVLKASDTDGSQNITIKNCGISLNQTNTATYGIYSNNHTNVLTTQLVIATAGGTNSNNKFFGNTFTNVYGGIYLYGRADALPYTYYDQGNEIGKDGANTFTSYGGGSATAYGIYAIYQNDFKIANNNFLGTIANTTGAAYAIYLSTMVNSNLDIYNNTITQVYNGTGAFYGIYSLAGASGTSNITNIYNNVVTACTSPNATSGAWYGIYMYGGMTANFYNNSVTNNIHGSATATATGSNYGMYFYSSPTNAGTMNVYGNTLSGNARIQSAIGSGTGYHFYLSGGNGTMNAYNNIVDNQTLGSSGTQYIVYILHSGAKNFYNNTITNILNSNGGTIYGIYNGNGAGNALFYNNKIQNINGNATGSIVYGIYQSSGANIYYYNNFISELKAPLATANPAIYGAYLSGGTALGMYNNTIYLNATSTGASFGTCGIYASTTPALELRNNIVVNNSTPGATGRTVAYQRSSTTLTTYASTSNNNDFLAGTPSATNLIYYDGTNSDQTIAAYKSRVAPRDAASVTENPPFGNVTTIPYNLHLQTTIATQCESGGARVTTPIAITTDIDNQIRQGETGYTGTGVAPDIGADEFNGILLDLNPPSISYIPFLNTASTSARMLTATIIDASGVPTIGTGRPVLYWRIGTGSWNNIAGTSIGGGQYTFNFGAGVVLGNVVQYYIVAQDNYSTPNVGVSPSLGAAGFSFNPPAVATPPTTPNSYTIVGTICGTFNVGTGQTYPTLTAAINDLNNKEMSCAVTFVLTDATYSTAETFPLIINANSGSSATNTLTIKTGPANNATISGAAPASPLIRILNPNTIIDGANTAGGTTRNLTITNTSTTTPQVINIASNGALAINNVTVKNCIAINGVNSSSAIVVNDLAGTAGLFTNITIQNNSIQTAYIALYILATSTTGNGSVLITQNDFNTSGANSVRLCAIYVQGSDGAIVSNNNIGNMANTIDASNLTGIWFATGTINSTILNNTISTLSGTSTAPRGIAVSSAFTNSNITITGNNINTLTTSSSTQPYGIYVFSTTTGVSVTRNSVSGLLNSNTGGYGARAIYVATALAASNIDIANNLVWDVVCTGDASQTYWGIGIGIDGTTGGVNVYHNSVNLYGTYAGYSSGTITAAFYSGTGSTALNVRDNIFVNSYDNTTSTTDVAYSIYCATGNTAFTSINYNDYFVSGTPGVLGYLSSNITTLAAWKTATAQDINSQNLNPSFVSDINLTPTNVSLDNLGTYLTAYPKDFNNVNRTNPPDMGAIEFGTNPAVTTLAASAITTTTAALNGSVNANTLVVNTFFDYGLTTSYGTSVAATPASVTGTTTTAISTPLTGLAASTTYNFRARGVTAGGVHVYGNNFTFTTTGPPPTVVTSAASAITGAGATLNGTVNANGVSTVVTFDYGLTTAYGSSATATQSPVSGTTVTPVSAPITGLAPNTLYNFRAKGVNINGTTNGSNLTFTTAAIPATVTTMAANNILTTSATLNGTVNANNASTVVTFAWGLSPTTLINIATATPSPVTGTSVTGVTANLTGLTTI
ncbi:MAG: hypothetical protein Q7J34_09055, partial [Bacteroidales bacterium]|nr:hypothetical protein [Bacteroidales bacterium]